VSGNVSFMGQSARFSVMPSGPQGDEIGITFGEYPYLITSTFTPAASIGGVELRDIPQPDPATLAFNPSIAAITMPVTAVYNTPDMDAATLAMAPSIAAITMPVTANYAAHVIHDVDNLTLSPQLLSITMVTP